MIAWLIIGGFLLAWLIIAYVIGSALVKRDEEARELRERLERVGKMWDRPHQGEP